MYEFNGICQVFFGGILGPVLLELVKLAAWREKTKICEKYRQWNYWIATIALLIVSGIVTVINGIEHVSLQRAIQLGINAPAIVAGYANASVARRSHAAGLPDPHAKLVVKPKSFLQRTTELIAW
jgi:hypothetical protein